MAAREGAFTVGSGVGGTAVATSSAGLIVTMGVAVVVDRSGGAVATSAMGAPVGVQAIRITAKKITVGRISANCRFMYLPPEMKCGR